MQKWQSNFSLIFFYWSLQQPVMHHTEALGKDLYETLDIKAKVLKKQENKQVLIKDVRKPNVKLIVLQLTHKTGLMGKHNWQSSCRENIPFQLLKVGFFDDVKYLNTSEATDLKEIDDLPCIDLISPEITDDTIEGRCISVHIKWCVSCLVWNVSITETQLGEETVTKLYQLQHNYSFKCVQYKIILSTCHSNQAWQKDSQVYLLWRCYK